MLRKHKSIILTIYLNVDGPVTYFYRSSRFISDLFSICHIPFCNLSYERTISSLLRLAISVRLSYLSSSTCVQRLSGVVMHCKILMLFNFFPHKAESLISLKNPLDSDVPYTQPFCFWFAWYFSSFIMDSTKEQRHSSFNLIQIRWEQLFKLLLTLPQLFLLWTIVFSKDMTQASYCLETIEHLQQKWKEVE